MFPFADRRLHAMVLAAIVSGASSDTAFAAGSAATRSPTPSAGDGLTIKALTTNGGIDIDLPPDWQLLDIASADEPNFGPTLLFMRRNPPSTLGLEVDRANGRSLMRYVHDHERQIGYAPGSGHPVRICHGTRDAWFVEVIDNRKPAERDPNRTGIAFLAVDRSYGLTATYLWDRPAKEDPRMRRAFTNMCLHRPARGNEP